MSMPMTLVAAIGDYFVWWQLPLVILLIALLVFYKIYKNRQM
jgi:hypothetical protein